MEGGLAAAFGGAGGAKLGGFGELRRGGDFAGAMAGDQGLFLGRGRGGLGGAAQNRPGVLDLLIAAVNLGNAFQDCVVGVWFFAAVFAQDGVWVICPAAVEADSKGAAAGDQAIAFALPQKCLGYSIEDGADPEDEDYRIQSWRIRTATNQTTTAAMKKE